MCQVANIDEYGGTHHPQQHEGNEGNEGNGDLETSVAFQADFW
jgi:hypothetical protein